MVPATRYSWCAAMALLTLFAIHPSAAQTYPTHPVRIVVPYPPGAATDIVTRLIGPQLGEIWSHQVVVDNRAGAGGSIAADIVSKAAPDGYTLLMADVAPLATTAAIYGKLPYDPIKDFAPISLVAMTPYVFVVNPSMPARTINEFIALAKARPGQLKLASSGNGSLSHLAIVLFMKSTGTSLIHVPYKGAGPAVTDLLAGQVDGEILSLPSSLPHIKYGKLRALAVTSATRSRLLPQVPSMSEAGIAGYEVTNWHGLLAPAGTPAAIVQKVHSDIVKILPRPDTREKLMAAGFEPIGSGPAAFAARIKVELSKWSPLAASVGGGGDPCLIPGECRCTDRTCKASCCK
ncbi:MAG: Tricarboxylate transport protein TctC [Betaproteobacteria bacterium]|nr:Tricarboxylate transport protein TctC [Betaproteobacteria bacterium]